MLLTFLRKILRRYRTQSRRSLQCLKLAKVRYVISYSLGPSVCAFVTLRKKWYILGCFLRQTASKLFLCFATYGCYHLCIEHFAVAKFFNIFSLYAYHISWFRYDILLTSGFALRGIYGQEGNGKGKASNLYQQISLKQ